MTSRSLDLTRYSREGLRREAAGLLAVVRDCPSFEVARDRLRARVSQIQFDTLRGRAAPPSHEIIRVRDCAAALNTILTERADARAGFSVAGALWDVALGRPRDDLQPAFYADLVHLVRGLQGRARSAFAGHRILDPGLEGRAAALARSRELDRLWRLAEGSMSRFASGLTEEATARREARKRAILDALGGSESDWQDWHWHLRHLIEDADALGRLVPLSDTEATSIRRATAGRLPFAVTPYYASLMDDDGSDRDRAIRAQVIPPPDYIDNMLAARSEGLKRSCDFMLESETSPIELVTRRYPAIVILKPFNTCPQICVYCQRNWEIEQAMAPGALARPAVIDEAIAWIARRSAIKEVLVTGGDPLALGDGRLRRILDALADIDHVDLIRIGSRVPVTVPMRIDDDLADLLGSYRELGRREVALVTHVEHPYELTMDVARAVDRLRRVGVAVYNQQVFTFFVSRRFESTLLRMLLRRIGIDPYYTFAPKGKEETASYLVPIARILQEQKEEARLVPGSRRTDETVYNVPGLGKNYLRAMQHRDLLSIQADGARVYEFHPWEKNVLEQDTYVGTDVPILQYLLRLQSIGEDPDEYKSIWYYF
ncbi:MAG TPA: KamA family radical SAM protein [Methylomirabilota bacterium]|nr:KamA family radical SAM protein [Methylomirabilota bacterium]